MQTILRLLQRLVSALWFGGGIFFSFIAAPAFFGGLPRDEAGNVVSLLFPGYYRIGLIVASILLLLCLIRLLTVRQYSLQTVRTKSLRKAALIRFLLALLFTGLILTGVLVIQPEMEALRAQIDSFAASAGDDPTRASFGRLHGYSMLLNAGALLVSLVFLIWE